jgi:2,3-bisphosphoglycerate-dependent phosphoglycerate mutase
MTTLYLVRHAHANWSADEERPLSKRGRTCATVLGDLLGGLPIGAIYSSPARRALETIEPLTWRLRLEPVIVDDLRERALVVAPGTNFDAAVRAAWRAPSTAGRGSESNDAAQARGLAAIRRIMAEQSERHTVVATHGNVLALILNGLNPIFEFEFWRDLTFPDAYELRFRKMALTNVRRIWEGAAQPCMHRTAPGSS